MHRRRLLAATGASAAIGLSGCLDAVPSRGSAPEPKEHPALPESLTTDSVLTFVEEYETVEFYNHILETEENPESISVTCNAVFDRETESAFYVLTRCGGSASLRDGTAEYPSVAYGGTTYRVAEDRVEHITASPSEHVSSAERGDRYLVLLANFGDIEHDLTAVVRSSPESDATLFDASRPLTPGQGVEHHIERPDTEPIELRLGLDGETPSTVEVRPDRSEGVAIYVAEDGLDVGTLSSVP